MGFQERTDEPWAFIAPFLPPRAKTGRPRVEDRKVLRGILDPGCRLPVVRSASPIWRRSDGPAAVSGTPGEGGLAPDPAIPSGLGVYAGEGEGGGGGDRFHTGGGEKRGEGGVSQFYRANFIGPRRVVGQLRAVVLRFWDTPGEGVGIDGHKRRKGTKARVWVNEDGLPLRVVVGPGNAHDRRRLEEARGACGGSGGADAAEEGICGCGG